MKVCSVCGKGKTFGNNVSHSKRNTNRPVGANLQKVDTVIDGKKRNSYVCTKCIKTAKKNANN